MVEQRKTERLIDVILAGRLEEFGNYISRRKPVMAIVIRGYQSPILVDQHCMQVGFSHLQPTEEGGPDEVVVDQDRNGTRGLWRIGAANIRNLDRGGIMSRVIDSFVDQDDARFLLPEKIILFKEGTGEVSDVIDLASPLSYPEDQLQALAMHYSLRGRYVSSRYWPRVWAENEPRWLELIAKAMRSGAFLLGSRTFYVENLQIDLESEAAKKMLDTAAELSIYLAPQYLLVGQRIGKKFLIKDYVATEGATIELGRN